MGKALHKQASAKDDPSATMSRDQPLLKWPSSTAALPRDGRGGGGRLPQRRQRPRHALSKNSLISNPLPPSRTQSLQPDFPQPSEMREISAVAREPDSSWRCSENCRRWRNNKARGTSARVAGAAAKCRSSRGRRFSRTFPPTNASLRQGVA